ncbi:MAG TPA: hypothetical protein VMR45_03740 [Patescibacteria group bacterium]|nr:hypothetical protein [Patescibacteria group bacterium]
MALRLDSSQQQHGNAGRSRWFSGARTRTEACFEHAAAEKGKARHPVPGAILSQGI